MSSEKNQNQKIQEMQFLEQNLQNLMLQKQAFQMELSETIEAANEINHSPDEVFKIVGQLMIQTNKTKMIDELKNKEKILDLRIKSIEKQEDSLTKQVEKIRGEVIKSAK